MNYNSLSDEELVKKAKTNDIDAFEVLIIKYEKQIYNIAYKYLHNEEYAKDVSQEVFLKVYKSLNKFNELSKFSTWLYRIAVNTSIDEIRKIKNKGYNNISISDKENELINIEKIESEISNENTPEEKFIEKEKTNMLYKILDELPEEQCSIIILRDIEGYSYEEISKITGIKIGTIKSRLNRARNSLKSLLVKSELFLKNYV